MDEKLRQLRERLIQINDIRAAVRVLEWDQNTYMPTGGAEARARQLATLEQLAHAKFTDPAVGQLLEELRPYEEQHGADSDDAALIKVARRDYERESKVPGDLVGQISRHVALAYEAWTKARPENDWQAVQPFVERGVELSRRYAECFPGYEHIADPLIDDSDYGMNVATVREVFAQLRRELIPLVEAVTSQPPADNSCLHRHFPAAEQLRFAEQTIRTIGYDFERGRQDLTAHPFMISFSTGDVRITTRVKENDWSDAFFSTVHEMGHALYEQGIDSRYEGTPLADGTSNGVHESQSRLWENLVGRSRQFWSFLYPRLQAAFPRQLGDVDVDTFYRAINKVERSLIRTDADELTYNLHVIVRFDLELDLLEGKLAVRELPAAWHARYRSDLGVQAPDDRDGVLQDVHWYAGLIGGAFQGYTLGNIMSAQIYDAALRAHPDIPEQTAVGSFGTLHDWLREHIYRYGRKYTAPEIIQRATGSPLRIEPYIAYLKQKYGRSDE